MSRNDILNRDLWTNTYFQMRREQRAAIAEARSRPQRRGPDAICANGKAQAARPQSNGRGVGKNILAAVFAPISSPSAAGSWMKYSPSALVTATFPWMIF